MKNNYFRKLIKYINDVNTIDQQLEKLTDGRVNPSYRTGKVILPVLIGLLLECGGKVILGSDSICI